MQIGGLGVMTMTAMISFFIGKRISLKTRILIMEERNVNELRGVVRLTRNILIYTFVAELIGAVSLSFVFVKDYGLINGVGYSIFHSVSAFCNAGFDLLGNSMMDYVYNPIITFTLCSLVIVGGLGFFVIWDVHEIKKFRRLSLHSKIVILFTSLLILVSTTVIFLLEYNNPGTMSKFSVSGKIQASIFQAISPRTAGFNSVPIRNFRIPTVVFVIFLMFIGGSPASTAGGVKTTTLAVMVISIVNLVKGKRDIEIFEKRIPKDVALKSAAVIVISMMLINLVTIILTITEGGAGFDYLDILFETVSAFATVGLSRGLTPELSVVGRIILSFVMFVGRVGPLTVVFGLIKQKKNIGNYTYPEGKVIIG
jgi:trk system potassium uptake protein TrkH